MHLSGLSAQEDDDVDDDPQKQIDDDVFHIWGAGDADIFRSRRWICWKVKDFLADVR